MRSSLPQRDKCAVAQITASSNVLHIAEGMQREGRLSRAAVFPTALRRSVPEPISDGKVRVWFYDLVL